VPKVLVTVEPPLNVKMNVLMPATFHCPSAKMKLGLPESPPATPVSTRLPSVAP
jgi:hypothetical protein